MSGLRQSVALAIARDQDDGGHGILTDGEVAALEWALMQRRHGDPDEERHRTELSSLLHQLGPHRMHISGLPTRVDAYWLHCADVAIGAYDNWLTERNRVKP